MPKPKDGLTNTTVSVETDFKDRLEARGKRLGIGWTTMLKMLARERLEQLEKADA